MCRESWAAIREEKFLGNLSKHQPGPLYHGTCMAGAGPPVLRMFCSDKKKKEHLREITHYQEQVTTAPWVVEVGTDAQPKQPPQITEGRQRPSGGRQ